MIEERVVPQRAADLDSAHVGRRGVEEDRVERRAPRELQRSAPALDAHDAVAVQLENTLERPARPLAVTGDQHQARALSWFDHLGF